MLINQIMFEIVKVYMLSKSVVFNSLSTVKIDIWSEVDWCSSFMHKAVSEIEKRTMYLDWTHKHIFLQTDKINQG